MLFRSGAAGGLYGEYIEKYMHHEEEVLTPPPADYEEEPKGWFYYDPRIQSESWPL